jgi:hypothetical protein
VSRNVNAVVFAKPVFLEFFAFDVLSFVIALN